MYDMRGIGLPGLLIMLAICLILLFAFYPEEKYEIETINGHEYLHHTGYRINDIEHSPDCWCMKDTLQ